MDDLDLYIDKIKMEWTNLWTQHKILLGHLTDILDGQSAKDISSLTGLSIEHCEKIIDDCYRLNQGKDI
jgi:hypothetical protein